MAETSEGIQIEENALSQPSSGEQSLIPPTPTPQPGEGTPTLPGDTGTEATDPPAASSDTSPVEGATPPAAPAAADSRTPPKYPDWFQKRINGLTREKNEARAEAEAARQQAAALLEQLSAVRAGQPAAPAAAPVAQAPAAAPVVQPQTAVPVVPVVPMTEAEIEARANVKANEIAKANAFNKACNDIAEAGKAEFKGEFDDALSNLNMMGGMPPHMLETLTEMPNAHRVIRALGSDPELAEKVLKLPPVKLAMELARVEAGLGKPATARPVSQAPVPITPVDAGARAVEDPEKMSTQQWISWREKTKKTRW